MSKESYYSLKTDLLQFQKRPAAKSGTVQRLARACFAAPVMCVCVCVCVCVCIHVWYVYTYMVLAHIHGIYTYMLYEQIIAVKILERILHISNTLATH